MIQRKREDFLRLLDQVIKLQAQVGEARVGFYQEKERVLERAQRLTQLKSFQTQNHKRIKELLLRTDPDMNAIEVEGTRIDNFVFDPDSSLAVNV